MLRRPRVSNIAMCILFIGGWFIASIVLFLVYSQTPYSPMDRKYLRPLGEARFPTVLRSKSLTSSGANYKPSIMLIWPYTITEFSRIHYKVLESILTQYPHTKIRIFNPTFDTQSPLYQSTYLFSKYHFLKYKKLYYNVELKTLSSLRFEFGNSYLNSLNNVIPLQFYNKLFIMLTLLYQQGGIVSDFSMYFQGKLNFNEFENGWFFDSFCQSDICYTNAILVFTPQHSVVQCVLDLYAQSTFISCLKQDKLYDGKKCIEQGFEKCAKKLNTMNDFKKYSSAILPIHQHSTGIPSEIDSGLIFSLGKWTLSHEGFSDILPNVSLSSETSYIDDSLSTPNTCSHYHNTSNHILNLPVFTSSCAPSIAIPQFMRTYSSYFHHLLLAHPQLLAPLDSCYTSNNKMKFNIRHTCYPFIESHESFSSIAASFSLAIDYQAPYLLKQDNPNIKVITIDINFRWYNSSHVGNDFNTSPGGSYVC